MRQGDSAVIMDCGPGTAGQIALHVAPRQLAGVAISHLHPDHYFDLVALYYVLKFGEPRGARLPVWVPPGGREFLDRFGQLIANKPRMLEDIFELREYPLRAAVSIGALEFTFVPVQHYIASHAMRVRSPTPTGAVLTFSSDVAPCATLPEAARDADLFLCESALLDAAQDDPAGRGHMSAVEAGAAAATAGAKRLVITHYRSSARDDAHHLAAARTSFGGPVELARPGATYVVGS